MPKKKPRSGDYTEFPGTPLGRLLRMDMLAFFSYNKPESVEQASQRLDRIIFTLLRLKYGITGSIPISYRVWNNTQWALKQFEIIKVGGRDGLTRNKMRAGDL